MALTWIPETTGEQVLLAGLPSRHLEAAVRGLQRRRDASPCPPGARATLDQAPPGTTVLLMISGQGAVPAATWRAMFVRRIEPPDDGFPDGLPPTWLEDRLAADEL